MTAGRTALVVIDLQNDFCAGAVATSGRHGDPTRLAAVAATTARAVEAARRRGTEVVFVRFLGDAGHQRPSWRRRDALLGRRPICREGTWGAEFHAVSPAAGERVVTKRACFDAFLGDGFEAHLAARGVDHLVFAGLFADVCVDSTARTAFQKGFHVTVLTDCTTSLHLPDEDVFRFMRTVYGARTTRHDRPDAWLGPDGGLAGGVGRTALLVAAARAIETHRGDSLAQDPYAAHFVGAARASAGWPVHPREVADGEADPLWGRLGRYFGLRTRTLDDFVRRALRAGVRQVVLLGAGLDTRAYRLDWPPESHVFEVDRAEVLAFKQGVLDGLGATPRAARVPVAADLRADWSAALTGAGLDPAAPTAWLAEGLLLYLPRAAERRLVATVDQLSAPGSALAYEVKLDSNAPVAADHPVYAAAKQRLGVDLLALFDKDERHDSAGDLAGRGWATSVHRPYDFTRRYGRGPRPEPRDALATNRWVFAHRGRGEQPGDAR